MSVVFYSAIAWRCFGFSSHKRTVLKYLKFNSEVVKGVVSSYLDIDWVAGACWASHILICV